MKPSNIQLIVSLSIITILIMLLGRSCATIKELKGDNQFLSEENQIFTTRITDDSLIIFTQALQINQSERAIDALKEKMEMAKVSQAIEYKTKTIYKTEIKAGDVVYVDSFPHLKLPRTFHKIERWLEIGGRVNRLGFIQIDSLIIPASYTVAIGDTLREGFISKILKRTDPVVRIGVDNPNINLTGMRNVVVRQDKKWYQTTAAKIGFGALLGITAVKLATP
jgi:hypothetical protein